MAFSQLYCLCFDDLLAYGRRVGGDNETVSYTHLSTGNLYTPRELTVEAVSLPRIRFCGSWSYDS